MDRVLSPGNGSFSESWEPGKFPMTIIPVVAFNDLYVLYEDK